ncbi:MAG: hypothetical protein OQL16_02165 [Gammaproteobacteria bacterium]|nr:hypothetical protein [Gammaproteobacteria bacterium]
MMGPWLGIVLVCVTLAALIAGLRLYQQNFNPHPEWVRKLLHILMGLMALTFPWIFEEPWPVWVLAVAAASGLFLLKFQKVLHAGFGTVVHGVERASLGEFYFPLSIAVVFDLANGNWLMYVIPILILTLADATAALIGVRYGKLNYRSTDSVKSVEGSVAFFLVTFFSVHVPLLLFSGIDPVNSLLVAMICGILVMLFEAVAWRGLDNLFIPLGGFFLLQVYWDMPSTDLLLRAAVVMVVLFLLITVRRLTTLNHSAAIGAALVGYVSWALGGLQWLLPPLLMLIVYAALAMLAGQRESSTHRLHTVVAVSSVGLIWLFINQVWPHSEYLFPYTLCYAAQLSMIGIVRESFSHPQLSGGWYVIRGVLDGWVFLFVPLLAMHAFGDDSLRISVQALVILSLSALFFYRWQPAVRDCPDDLPRWLRQVVVAGVASLAGYALI